MGFDYKLATGGGTELITYRTLGTEHNKAGKKIRKLKRWRKRSMGVTRKTDDITHSVRRAKQDNIIVPLQLLELVSDSCPRS